VINRIRIGMVMAIREKRIFLQSLVRESAAAWLLPGELFVEQKDAFAALGKKGCGECSGWTTSDNGNGVLCLHARWRIRQIKGVSLTGGKGSAAVRVESKVRAP